MLKMLRVITPTFVLVILVAGMAAAQDSPIVTRLGEQVARLEKAAGTRSTTPRTTERNRRPLVESQMQLKNRLSARLRALRAYVDGGGALTAREMQAVEELIQKIESELASLSRPVAPAFKKSLQAATYGNGLPRFAEAARVVPAVGDEQQAPAADAGPIVVNNEFTDTGALNPETGALELKCKGLDEGKNLRDCPDVKNKIRFPDQLVMDTLGKEVRDEADYIIIHIVNWDEPDARKREEARRAAAATPTPTTAAAPTPTTAAPEKYSVKKDFWYLYRRDLGGWSEEHFTGDRLFGSTKVAFLAVHVSLKSDVAAAIQTWDIKYTYDVKGRIPANIQNAIDLAKLILDPGKADRHVFTGKWGGRMLDKVKATSDIAVKGNVVFPKLVPRDLEITGRVVDEEGTGISGITVRLSGSTSRPGATDGDGKFTFTGLRPGGTYRVVAVAQNRTFDVPYYMFTRMNGNQQAYFTLVTDQGAAQPPIVVEGQSGGEAQTAQSQQPTEFTKTYVNESRHLWDISVGLPAKSLKEVQYVAADNTIRTKEVSRTNAYGFLNIFPYPTDLTDKRFPWYPHFVFGVPISGKPLDRPIAGIAKGFNIKSFKFDMFVGGVFNKVSEPRTLGVGETATQSELESDLRTKRVTKLAFGFNIPVSVFKKAIAGDKKE